MREELQSHRAEKLSKRERDPQEEEVSGRKALMNDSRKDRERWVAKRGKECLQKTPDPTEN